METKYKNIETTEIVKILQDNGKFYKLNNGDNISKELFIKKYQMLNMPESDPNAEKCLNTPTPITIERPKNSQPNIIQQPQHINESVTIGSDLPIDPINFLNATVPIKNIDVLNNVNTNKVVDPPRGQGTTIKINNPNDYQSDKPLSEDTKRQLIEQYNYKIKGQNIAGKFIDDGDDKSVEQFLQQGQAKLPEKKLNENGLTEEQEIIRQNQMQLTGEDPFKDKIAKYKKEHQKQQIQMPIQNNSPTVTTNSNITQDTNYLLNESQEDPTNKIFKSFKRNYKINIKLDIEDQISKPEFIQIMADGLEGDIIEYFTNEIIRNYLVDTQKIHDDVYNQLYKKVYGEDKKTDEKKPVTPVKKTTKTSLAKTKKTEEK